MLDLTKEERAAIKALQRLDRMWPESLMLFSNAGFLEVHKTPDSDHCTDSTNLDVIFLNIRNDGGDRD